MDLENEEKYTHGIASLMLTVLCFLAAKVCSALLVTAIMSFRLKKKIMYTFLPSFYSTDAAASPSLLSTVVYTDEYF